MDTLEQVAAAPELVESPPDGFIRKGLDVCRAVTRRVFSFPVALAACLVVLVTATVAERFNDPDLWWHLQTGKIIWTTHSIPRTDLFSWTTHNHAWTAHEWLSQLSMYAAYHAGGYMGLAVWLVVISSIIIVGQYALSALHSGNAKVAFLGAMLAWLFATVGFSIRPQLLGYALFTAELLIIHFGRNVNRRYFFVLPFLFAAWVNCHGSFSLGLIVAAVYLGTSFLEFRSGSLVSDRWDRQSRNALAVALGLSLLAVCCNPVGARQLLYPFDVLFNQPNGVGYVDEWQPLHLGDVRAAAMFATAAVVFAVVLFRRAVLRLDELILFAFGFAFAIQHHRMLFVFGLLAAPIVSRLLADKWDHYNFAKDRRLPNAVLIGLATVVAMAAFPSTQDLSSQVTKGNPTKAVEFIKRSGLQGPMLNDYVFGGYLIWALPEHKVFVDGRADVYEWTGVLGDFAEWATLQKDPRELLDRYGVAFCILAKEAPLARVLPYLPGWTKIYGDDHALIFQRVKR